MIAMNTKNWHRNVEVFILVVHPWKPEQIEENKLYYNDKFVNKKFPTFSSNCHQKYATAAQMIPSGWD